jgi:RNA polymerase-binding transcription factor DksA
MKPRKAVRSRRKPRAATADILGLSRRERPIRPAFKKYYRRLIELRDGLLQRQTELARDANDEQPTFSTHMADAATDEYDRDFALGMLSSEQDALYQVEQALDRIRNGTFGICELTGKRIEHGRLEAIPWTRFSLAAEKTLEQEGAVKRRKLGDRETVGRTAPASDESDSED